RHGLAGHAPPRAPVRPVHARQHRSGAGQWRSAVGRTVLFGALSSVHLAGDRHSLEPARRLDRVVRGAAGLQRRAVLHVATTVLKSGVRYPLLSAVALLSALTVIVTWPVALHPGTRLPGH